MDAKEKSNRNLARQRTKRGVVIYIRSQQNKTAKRDGKTPPNYSSQELYEWAVSQPIFHILYDAWYRSGYDTWLKPSFDRLDDYKGYSLDNLQITTWRENFERSRTDMINGVNTKSSKSVLEYTLDGDFVAEYYSQHHAARETGLWQAEVSMCCRGLRDHARGHVFKRKTKKK